MHNIVLGLKLNPYHDTGAAIVADDGRRVRVVAISEERLDRCKKSHAFPSRAIAYCLDAIGCRLQDVRLVVADFFFKPGTDDQPEPSDGSNWDVKAAFFRQLEARGIRVEFINHHLCHAASAYFATSWSDAATLVIDGIGSLGETQSLFRCEGNRLTTVATSRRPGIGLMYSAVTEHLLGFGPLQEGKTMGLAGHTADSTPWRELFRPPAADSDDPFDIAYPQFVKQTWPHWVLSPPLPRLANRTASEDPLDAPFVQYAHAAQVEVEAGVMRLVAAAASMTPSRRLCYAGGVALNIPANRLILDSGLFDEMFIQPAASDAGIPLGAALLGYYTMLDGQIRWEMPDAFLGRDYAEAALDDAASQWMGERAASTTAHVARLLANDYLIGWHQGASEYGPRALGHRSILCSPRDPRMKAYLNQEVKHREMFRPFAPLVPIEHLHEFFDLPVASPFMLLNARVHPDKAALMPAVVHADGTARVQTIRREEQPALHALLHEMGRLTGIPVLVNTSLNLAGEPIVETPADVVSLFERSRLDALVMGPHLLTKAPLSLMLERPNPGLAAMAPASDRTVDHAWLDRLRAPISPRVVMPETVPAAVEERLRTILTVLGQPAVILWGNGSHTRALVRVLDRIGGRVRTIVDARAAQETVSPEGLPVLPGKGFMPGADELIVLSSHAYEAEMWHDLAAARTRGAQVLALYDPDLMSEPLRRLFSTAAPEKLDSLSGAWFATPRHAQLFTTFTYESDWGRAINETMMQAERAYTQQLLAELDRDQVPGAIVEFGVFGGDWLSHLASYREALGSSRHVWGFDSFEGLPTPTEHDLDCWHAGQYAADIADVARKMRVAERPWVHLEKGWFEESLRRPHIQAIETVAFARIDCDLHAPTVDCLRYLTPRLADGAVLVFDDWTYTPHRGETKAFIEWMDANPPLRTEFLLANAIGHIYFRVRHRTPRR